MNLTTKDHIEQINPGDWQRLNGSLSPFLALEYFKALEASGCVSGERGWSPHHLVFSDDNGVCGILPSFIKSHSWGEFVFDWDWAEAFEQHGYDYYPKLVSTIPFTPVPSDKLLTNDLCQQDVFSQVIEHCAAQSLNSWHLLFCPPVANIGRVDVFERNTVQFHWFNREYHDFEHFLSTFTARKRKNSRKERLSIIQQGIEITRFSASEITEKELDFFYLCYQQPYLKRGHTPHLNREFFQKIFSSLSDNVLLIIASHQQRYVASALFLFDQQALYGRYWGCVESFNNLHFELCYYQGIEYCIEQKLQSFNPGAQGEHKIKRGFEPIMTYSYHWVKQAEFSPAIKDFCQRERQHMQHYFNQCQLALPFKHQ